ncbi:MAG: EamA family transporter [Steroidobacteraceae bacterium]
MSASRRQRRLLLLCLATVYLVWGTSYIATRIGVTNLPPLLFGGVRFMIGGILMLALARWRGADFAPLRAGWRHVLVMGVLSVAVCNGLQVWAMQWVTSQAAALLNASSALWIVIFGLFGARSHRPSSRAVAGLAIGFIGTALLVWPSPQAGNASPLVAQLAILGACVVWAVCTIYMRNTAVELDLFAFGGAQMLLGGVLLTLAGLLRGEAAAWHPSVPGLLAMAYLVIFSSCLAYTAYWWLARHATPALVGTYSYVNPLITAAAGFLILAERLTPLQIGGGAVILASVLLIYWPTSGSIRRV